MLYKNDAEKARERWSAWWNGELTDRCCVNITAGNGKPYTEEEYRIMQCPEDPEELTAYWTDAEWVVKRTRIGVSFGWYGADKTSGYAAGTPEASYHTMDTGSGSAALYGIHSRIKENTTSW